MSTPKYTSGTIVTTTIPLTVDGVNISASSISYRVLGGDDTELVTKTLISTYNSGDASVDVITSSLVNTINSLDTREARLIELFVTTDSGEIRLESWYIIELSTILIEGINSFQGYGKALVTSMTLNKIPNWDDADKEERCNALIEARRNIGALPLRHYFYDVNTVHIDNDFIYRDITLLTQSQYQALPENIKSALCRAQLLQADYILNNDESQVLRDSGVVEMAVGEAKKIFKQSKKLKTPVCERAMNELSRWLVSGQRISR